MLLTLIAYLNHLFMVYPCSYFEWKEKKEKFPLQVEYDVESEYPNILL